MKQREVGWAWSCVDASCCPCPWLQAESVLGALKSPLLSWGSRCQADAPRGPRMPCTCWKGAWGRWVVGAFEYCLWQNRCEYVWGMLLPSQFLTHLSMWDPAGQVVCPPCDDRGLSLVVQGARSWLSDFPHACMHVCPKSHSSLCDPMDCSPPVSSVHGISQTSTLEWVAIPCCRVDLPNPGIEPESCALLAGGFFITVQPGEAPLISHTWLLTVFCEGPTCWFLMQEWGGGTGRKGQWTIRGSRAWRGIRGWEPERVGGAGEQGQRWGKRLKDVPRSCLYSSCDRSPAFPCLSWPLEFWRSVISVIFQDAPQFGLSKVSSLLDSDFAF